MLGFFEKHIPLLGRLHLIDLAHSFVDGLRAIQSPRTLFWSVAWSAVLWLGGAAGLATGVAAVGIPITAPMIFFLMVVSNLGMAVPSAPGYVGVYHALVIAGLTPFGVPQTAALSAGIVIHAVVFGYFLLGGLVYLWLGRFSLSQLISGARESEHGP